MFYRCGITGQSDPTALIDGTATSLKTNATGIKHHLFYQDTTIQSVDAQSVTTVGNNAFESATGLQSIKLGQLTSIGQNAFYGTGANNCDFSVWLNNATVSNNAFLGSKLTRVSGTWSSAGNFCLRNCKSLKSVVFNLAQMPNGFLYDCTALTNLSLLYDGGVVTLGTDSMKNVPTTCTVEVPSALASAYMEDSFWGNFPITAIVLND